MKLKYKLTLILILIICKINASDGDWRNVPKKPRIAITMSPLSWFNFSEFQNFGIIYRNNYTMHYVEYSHRNYSPSVSNTIFMSSFMKRQDVNRYKGINGTDIIYHYKHPKSQDNVRVADESLWLTSNIGARIKMGTYTIAKDTIQMIEKSTNLKSGQIISPRGNRIQLAASWGACYMSKENSKAQLKRWWYFAPFLRWYMDVEVIAGIQYQQLKFDYDHSNYQIPSDSKYINKYWNTVRPIVDAFIRVGVVVD